MREPAEQARHPGDVARIDAAAHEAPGDGLRIRGRGLQGQARRAIAQGNRAGALEQLVVGRVARAGVAFQLKQRPLLGLGPQALAAHERARGRQRVHAQQGEQDEAGDDAQRGPEHGQRAAPDRGRLHDPTPGALPPACPEDGREPRVEGAVMRRASAARWLIENKQNESLLLSTRRHQSRASRCDIRHGRLGANRGTVRGSPLRQGRRGAVGPATRPGDARARPMSALDTLNPRFGRDSSRPGTTVAASNGADGPVWATKQDRRSPRFTSQ